MSRKYRQHGYQDYEKEESKTPKRNEGPSPKMQQQRVSVRVFKCSLCGNEIKDTTTISLDSTCPKCRSDLHSCVNCGFFDPSSQFQCMKDVPRNMSPKDKRNDCELYSAKNSIEKRFINVESHHDARQAFENLFKKI